VLQRAYHVVNRDRSRELPLTDDARARLEAIYQPANARLAEILRARGIGNLPGWLDGGG
jgi:hypothetical protein